MKLRASVLTVMLLAGTTHAEKLRGFLWESSAAAIVVEGQAIRIVPETKIERQNHKDITAKDLRVGWEVEVDARGDGELIARKVKVKNARFQEEKIEGVVDGVNHVRFFVDGDEIRMTKGTVPPGLKAGMRFKGKGIRQDDRSIELKEGELLPAGFVGEEAQFMAAVSQEIGQMKSQIKGVNNPELQAYVDSIGKSLVPKWVDPSQFQFTFTIVQDPNLNAFALPDGTVVVYTGLLAVLENEAQLATVLGHEIAHATHRHGYRGFKSQQKKQMWFGLGAAVAGLAIGSQTDDPLIGMAAGVGMKLAAQAAVNGHGRKLEDEADLLGLHYMTEAGYDYMEAPEVWRVFGRYTKDMDKVSNFFFSNHSTHAARIKNLTKEINADYRTKVPRDKLRTGEEEYGNIGNKLTQENAMANAENKNYGVAADALAESIERNPNDANAYFNHARVLWEQGGVKNAQKVMDQLATAIELDPTLPGPWKAAGVVFYEVRDVNRAAQAFEKYLQLAPDDPDAPKLRAFVSQVKRQ